MKAFVRFSVSLLLVLTSAIVSAQTRDVYQFDTPEKQQRFQTLLTELRCPKCQNQNIADSNAPISKDMRDAVYTMMSNGASDEEITGALVSRFGEFVRYKPRLEKRTFMLWATPALVIFVGVLVVILTVRRTARRASEKPSAVTDEERARASRLLNDDDSSRSS